MRNSDHRPVPGATVCLETKDQTGPSLTVLTDSTGAYHFLSVRPGPYTLRAEMAGHGIAAISSLTLMGKESKTINLILDSARLSGPQNSSAARPDFFDEPHFTVAGVTDTTNLGGHGSDTVVRNREALAKDAASMNQQSPGNAVANSEDYERERAKVLLLLAAQIKSGQERAEPHHLLAEIDEKLGQPLEAVREYQRAAELDPSESNLFGWGSELLLHHAAEPAIEVFTKGNRLFPHSVRMLTALGAAWYARGSYAEAAQSLCEASDLDPNNPNPYLFMGKMQAVEIAESEGIAERLGRFVRLQPENALANYYYAVSLWRRSQASGDAKDLARVKSLLEKAVHLDPKLGLAYLQLGIVDSEQKDLPGAISAYRQAIEATPLLEQAHYRLAQAYRQSGETTKAQAELQAYEQISKDEAEETERQRHEVQQFVYQLQEQPAAAQLK